MTQSNSDGLSYTFDIVHPTSGLPAEVVGFMQRTPFTNIFFRGWIHALGSERSLAVNLYRGNPTIEQGTTASQKTQILYIRFPDLRGNHR